MSSIIKISHRVHKTIIFGVNGVFLLNWKITRTELPDRVPLRNEMPHSGEKGAFYTI